MRSRNQEAREAVHSLVYSTNGDYHFGWGVATWLRYKGDLKDLHKDAYLKFDSITCENLPEKEEKWPNIEVTSDKCYKILALSNKDPSLCEKISNQSEKDECFRILAVYIKDSSLCERIITESLKNECYDAYYRYRALEITDPSLCEKILDGSEKYLCYLDFVGNRLKEVSECEERMPSRYSKDICFGYFARETLDFSLCEKIIEDKKEKDQCYYQIAIKTKDKSLCEKVTDQRLRDSCMRTLSQ
jgi:hypothetical protein